MMNTGVYGYPLLGRTGLGNMLFSWARCYLWCKDNGFPMIAPRWTQLRVGPYLRREQDKRNYQKLFRHDGYVSGLRRLGLLGTASKIPEAARGTALAQGVSSTTVVVFQGMEALFEPILGRSHEIQGELRRITRQKYLPDEANATSFIGIHVRRGDFRSPDAESEVRGGVENVRLPLAWYGDLLRRLRHKLGFEAQALVFSDGSEEELREILALPAVTLRRGGAAITDMLALSQANAIIASGSTFSMWGSYLGQVPAIWYPGQRRQLLLGNGDELALEPEIATDEDFPAPFLAAVTTRWNASFHGAS